MQCKCDPDLIVQTGKIRSKHCYVLGHWKQWARSSRKAKELLGWNSVENLLLMGKLKSYKLEEISIVWKFWNEFQPAQCRQPGLGSLRELDSLPSEALGTLLVSEALASTSSSVNTEVGPSGKKGAKGRRRVGTIFIFKNSELWKNDFKKSKQRIFNKYYSLNEFYSKQDLWALVGCFEEVGFHGNEPRSWVIDYDLLASLESSNQTIMNFSQNLRCVAMAHFNFKLRKSHLLVNFEIENFKLKNRIFKWSKLQNSRKNRILWEHIEIDSQC